SMPPGFRSGTFGGGSGVAGSGSYGSRWCRADDWGGLFGVSAVRCRGASSPVAVSAGGCFDDFGAVGEGDRGAGSAGVSAVSGRLCVTERLAESRHSPVAGTGPSLSVVPVVIR